MAAVGQQEKEPNKSYVHVRENSDKELQALFDIALNKEGQRPLQVPMRMRMLPASFWQPPTHGSKSPSVHSRENSLDNSMGPFSPGGGGGGPVPSPPVGAAHHSRANSCPATLGQTLAVAQQHQNHSIANHHLRQQSYDVGGGEEQPLPPGWEMAKAPTGQYYFMNHITKTTQWEDPRKAIQQQMLNQLNGTASPRSSAVSSPVPNGQSPTDRPLPEGWEQTMTPEGETYFLHHPTKRTTWYDPRIPIHAQNTPALKQATGQESALSQAQKLQQESRLRRLENERHRLQQKRVELYQSITRQQQDREVNKAVTQTQEMMMRHSLSEGGGAPTKMDPFLTAQGETHNRQESADSGLGMGSNYNLGIISEDVGLESMDTDLDTTLTDTNQQQQQQQQAGQPAQQGMDTEELIPTLPELGEELSRDFMNTIFSTNTAVENELTWL